MTQPTPTGHPSTPSAASEQAKPTAANSAQPAASGSNAPAAGTSPANRLGLDYRAVPPRKLATPIVDVHTHVRSVEDAGLFMNVAALYGIWHIVSMTPLENVPALRERYPDRLSFIAIPQWREQETTPDFQARWLAELDTFRSYGARVCKFWSAPPMRGKHGITLQHAFLQPVIEKALDLGYSFMTHVGDPTEWFEPGGRYEDHAKFGNKREQFDQLEFFLEKVSPRPVIGAHFGGHVEDLAHLGALLDRYPHYHLDTSATKWIVRGVAQQPEAVREFVTKYQDRLLFGSDLVTGDQYDFDHYASRYWSHQMMWETPYRGECPIADPDAVAAPQLAGVDLPIEILRKLYVENAERLGVVGEGRIQ